MKKILIIGGSGMLGHKLLQVLRNRFEVWTTLRAEYSRYKKLNLFDLNKTIDRVEAADFEKIETIINILKPDVVINAVGIIKQSPASKDVIATLKTNSIFPHEIARIAKNLNFKFITISTDCVFDGERGNYTETDVPNASDLYGKSKNLGEVIEENCLTLRTSIIGREIESSNSLVEWLISHRGGQVKGFKKAIYTGFPTIVLADIIGNIIDKFPDLEGLYHLSSNPINKFDLLNLVNKQFNLGIAIEPDEQTAIDRSLNSEKFRLETNFAPQTWDEMVTIMANDPTPYNLWRNRKHFTTTKE